MCLETSWLGILASLLGWGQQARFSNCLAASPSSPASLAEAYGYQGYQGYLLDLIWFQLRVARWFRASFGAQILPGAGLGRLSV